MSVSKMDALAATWTWLSQNSNGIGILLSLVGFGITWYQMWKTRNAAEAAQVASNRAVQAMSDNDTIADLAMIKSELAHLQIAIREKHYEVVLLQAQPLRERFHQLR